MTGQSLILRERARRDIEQAVDHYRDAAGNQTALRFIDALARAFDHITRHPATGSPRYGHEVGLPGLRHWSLRRFPYLVFYVERNGQIDVWRVLHGGRDIPQWMRLETF